MTSSTGMLVFHMFELITSLVYGYCNLSNILILNLIFITSINVCYVCPHNRQVFDLIIQV